MLTKRELYMRRVRRNRRRLMRSGRLRLSVFRSNRHVHSQIIDDSRGCTLAAASTLDPAIADKIGRRVNRQTAALVGELIAQRAREVDVREVVFDRGGHRYHGVLGAFADAARAEGLSF